MDFRYNPGSTPLLISIPHAGVELSDGLEDRMTPAGLDRVDTDWHVDRLYRFAGEFGASLLVSEWSRYAADLNRSPDDKALYPGAGTGLVPLTTFAGEPLYLPGKAPDQAEQTRRVSTYWKPYHDTLAQALGGILARHGHAVLLDGHSIMSRVPRLFEGRLPDLNLGTNNGASCAPALAEQAWAVLSGVEGFSAVRDGRFRGGYITRHYGRPETGVHALQLEIAQACYMDEDGPGDFDEQRAKPLIEILRRLVEEVLSFEF